VTLLTCEPAFASEPKPLIHGHAHNDYLHPRPLFDALDHGFCNVEADIFLIDGQLLVAHARGQTRTNKTLIGLYLEPLRERVKHNQGRVYPSGPEFTLLIDLKTDWETTYPVLRDVLKFYDDILTTFHQGTVHTNAVTVVLTGERSLKMFSGETVRYAAYDGRLSELDSNASPKLVPWISSQWSETFHWTGVGDMPAKEQETLDQLVRRTHQQGRRLRFWGAPDKPAFWRELLRHKVDLINTDDLAGLQKFFEAAPELNW
jgi:hypothetical protein